MAEQITNEREPHHVFHEAAQGLGRAAQWLRAAPLHEDGSVSISKKKADALAMLLDDVAELLADFSFVLGDVKETEGDAGPHSA